MLVMVLALGGSHGAPAGFMIFFILALVAIIGWHAYNAFSRRGVTLYQVDVDNAPSTTAPTPAATLEADLRRLARMRDEGLINEEEYQEERRQALKRNG